MGKQRRTATYGRDLQIKMFMHIGSCAACNATQMAVKARHKLVPEPCEEGRSLGYEWLEYRHRIGDSQATAMLDALRAMGRK